MEMAKKKKKGILVQFGDNNRIGEHEH